MKPMASQRHHGQDRLQCKHYKRNILIVLILLMSVSTALMYKYNTATEIVKIGRYYCGKARIQQPTPVHYSLNKTESFGYIVSNAYSGQQGSGVRALLSLQCWAASFELPMYIVEPYIERHSLSTRLKYDGITNPTKFSDYFNMSHFNNVSMQENVPPLVSWDTFINNAPRNAIVALIHNDFSCKKYGKSHFRVIKKKTSCFPEKWLHNQQLAEVGFCAAKVVKLWGCLSHPESIKKMYGVIFEGWRPEPVTLIFRMWAANWDKLQNPDTEDRLTCKDANGKKMQHKFHPSLRLVNEAKYYTGAFLNSRNKVALMIRSEQAIRGFKAETEDRVESLNTCLKKSVELAKTLLDSNEDNGTSAGGIFLTLDIGKYGSNSMEWVLGLDKYNLSNRSQDVMSLVKNVVPLLYDDKWTFRDWENSFTQATDGIDNPGYIASLQRTIASQADCLILLGGGDYQRLALHDYLENHPHQQCLHFLCFTESYWNQFTRVVEEYSE